MILRCTKASCFARWSLLVIVFFFCAWRSYLPQPYALKFRQNPLDYEGELRSLLERADGRSQRLIRRYNRHDIFDDLQLDLGPSVRYRDYAGSIEQAANDLFPFAHKHPRTQYLVHNAKAAAALHAHPLSVSELGASKIPMPERLCTTAKNATHLPDTWNVWKMLNPHLDVVVYNDNTMEDWLNENLNLRGRPGELSFREEYERLPRMILKSDFYRYLQVFFEGGIYADSDTEPLHAITEWGNRGTTQDWTDKRMLALTTEAQKLGRDNKTLHDLVPINEAPPMLIFAIEYWTNTWWNTVNCGMQTVQWVFAAQPGHPVFLDLFQHIINVSHEVDRAKDPELWLSDDAVFQWTGPCIFASAVWRYLWARWGFDYTEVIGAKHPVRVGDVLIMPYGAMQATFSELHVEQPMETMLWHGAHGFGENGWRTREAVAATDDGGTNPEKTDPAQEGKEEEPATVGDGSEEPISPLDDATHDETGALTTEQQVMADALERARRMKQEKVDRNPLKLIRPEDQRSDKAEVNEELRS